MSDSRFREQLKKYALDEGLDILILFGSHAKGNATKKSDIDIGIVSSEKPDLLKMTNDLTQITHHNDIDIVDLRSCDPVVGMQILRYGEVIHRKDGAWGTIGSYIGRRYADTRKFREAGKKFLKRFVEERVKP